MALNISGVLTSTDPTQTNKTIQNDGKNAACPLSLPGYQKMAADECPIPSRDLIKRALPPPSTSASSFFSVFQILWGVGVSLWILAMAISGLIPHVMDSINYSMDVLQWCSAALAVLIMAYVEGYRAFYLSFSPMVIARSLHLSLYPPTSARFHFVVFLLYPLYVFGLVYAPRKRLIISWLAVVMVGGFVVAVHFLPVPWRGIVDGAVIVGLSLGILSMLYFLYRVWKIYPDSLLDVQFSHCDPPLWLVHSPDDTPRCPLAKLLPKSSDICNAPHVDRFETQTLINVSSV